MDLAAGRAAASRRAARGLRAAARKLRTAAPALLAVALVADPSAATGAEPECAIEPLAIDAALGDATAQYNLAVAFFRGRCVPRDLTKAAVLWRKAAEGGELSAYNNLGWLTFHGRGVAADEAEGLRLWRHAAERGHAESQSHLAWAYLEGRGVPRDPVLAYAWARASVESARRWPDLGGGDAVERDARENLRRAQERLPESHRVEAERKAQVFVDRYRPPSP